MADRTASAAWEDEQSQASSAPPGNVDVQVEGRLG